MVPWGVRADDIDIPHPCPIDLREHVSKASSQFHCDRCDRTVHVLSHLSEDEAERVLARRERDNLCVAFLRATDGRVRFRRDGESLVPVARLRDPGGVLRASALALAVMGCSTDEGPTTGSGQGDAQGDAQSKEQVERVEHVEQVEHAEQVEHVEVLGGPPPVHDTFDGSSTITSSADRRVKFEELTSRHTPNPPDERLREAMKDGSEPSARLIVAFCVDTTGRVVDAKLRSGDKVLGATMLETMKKRWRFEPFKVDGQAIRVCTEQKIELRLPKLM